MLQFCGISSVACALRPKESVIESIDNALISIEPSEGTFARHTPQQITVSAAEPPAGAKRTTKLVLVLRPDFANALPGYRVDGKSLRKLLEISVTVLGHRPVVNLTVNGQATGVDDAPRRLSETTVTVGQPENNE